MSNDDLEQELPEWTFRGGYFRPGISTNDVPTSWTGKTGRWKRDELVPYGKANDEYRKKFYLCPECDRSSLVPGEKEYTFVCASCQMEFGWSFGGLYEKEDENRYTPEDF
jgi:ribosomal protein L37AE/L43A